MPLPLWKTTDPGFADRLAALKRKLSLEEGLEAAGRRGAPPLQVVRSIIADVRERGDEALLEHTERLDGCRLEADQLRVSTEEIARARSRCSDSLLAGLEMAAERVRTFQEATLIRDPEPVGEEGRTTSLRYRPVGSAAVCVPGAAASLASSVIMAAVPARVAGVKRLVMASAPGADGSISDDRLAAAAIAGVDEVYRMGGAQAVAALAYGTETISPVDFIAGPGNIFVTVAKKEVFGQVGIESLPGPSEVVIVADESARPQWVAADLVAQAEHNPGSAILLTDSEELALRVIDAVEAQLDGFPRADQTRACLEEYGAAVVTTSLEESVQLSDELAPEHLQLMTETPEQVAGQVSNAGAIFVGPWTPVATGDYLAGPSHVLPTGRTARFSGGLSANDFLKRTSVIRYDRDALRRDAREVGLLARAEGLEGHARSVEMRTEPREQ